MRQFSPEHLVVLALTAAAIAVAGNLITGSNYMYLRAKPSQASLLDPMGPWPVYVVAAPLVALLLFAALDRLARSRPC